jgi:putative transposase
MGYEFRRMTAEEREAVVRERLARDYPLHAPPHPFRGNGRFLLSATNFEHQPIMAAAERRTEFEERLLAKLKEIEAELFAWVVLPNHYHVLVGVGSLKTVSQALKQLHGVTSRAWNLADDYTGERQVWYHFHDRKIRGDKHFYRALNLHSLQSRQTRLR